jgi:phage shock protein E
MTIQELVVAGQGTIVDVRSRLEFSAGHFVDSVNVPLEEVNASLERLRSLTPPIILVCVSGNRSGMAEKFLTSNKLDCLNGGSWLNVNFFSSLKGDK